MTAQPHHETPMSTGRLQRHDDRAAVHRGGSTHQTEFDAHRWLEHYLAVHRGSDAADRLAGVPFN